ncbi:PREDICTED: uncharacterized protein LOC107336129 [Acropora digitifera]|uniref:uncharacterized protein LOC107336129 n=1 Tax=Acropora digitifera TaxID=70779 RepID=UPI00077A0AB2|nr:PREDICTED: uncharacterized protein LOC107336129 [Acropora digitifera]
MTHGNSTYFRSKSLNDEWEDLSQSVSYVLKVHKGPEFNKAETSSQTITTTHWVEAIERTHCSERNCGKKFSLTVRKHHCRRCGEVFCNQCSQFKRRLSLLAIPDPNGVSYRVCKRCFDVGPQILGTICPRVEEFNVWRERKSRDRHNKKNTGTDPESQHLHEIYEELQRLVNGYRNHLSKSKIKSFVAEALSLVKIPEWQKSKYWMTSSSVSICALCDKRFSVAEIKSNCKVCGAVICSSCSSETLILFPTRPSHTVKWALINIIGSPDEEPTGCLYLRICNACHDKAALLQGKTVTDGVAATTLLDDIINVHQMLSSLKFKICSLLPEYEKLVDHLEAKTDFQGLVPVEGSVIQTIARYHLGLSDLFTQFAFDLQSVRRLKPQTNTQLKLAKNLTSALYNFYSDNFSIFRNLKRRTVEVLPEEMVEKVQLIVDTNAINCAYIYIKQLGLEALMLADKHKFEDEVATFLADCESTCLQDLKSQIDACHEDWEQHKQNIEKLLKSNLKEHRLIIPSKGRTIQKGSGYVQTYLFDRCGHLIFKTLQQLQAKTLEKKFCASKAALQNLSKQFKVNNP